MRRRIAAFTLVLFSSAALAGGSCRVIEYGEIKDSSTKELVEKYCHYKALTNILHEQTETLLKLGPAALSMTDKPMAEARECTDQIGKLVDALKRRKFQIKGQGGADTCAALERERAQRKP
jgi:hypothetical protein